MSKYKVVRSSPNEEPGFAGNNREGPLRKIPLKAIKTALALQLEMSMRLRIMRFHADMRIYAVAVYPICAYVFNMRMIRILIYADHADMCIMHMSFPNRICKRIYQQIQAFVF